MEYWNPEKIVRCGVKIDAHIYIIIIIIIPSKFDDQYYGPCAKQGWWYQLKRQKLWLNSMVNGDDSLPSHHYPHDGLYWHAYKSSTLQTASQVRDCSLQHQQNKIIRVSTVIVLVSIDKISCNLNHVNLH